MKRDKGSKRALLFLAVALLAVGCGERHRPHRAYVLWYDRPAAEWTEALPVGNGRLGGMLFGNPVEERLQVNEESLWGGTNVPNNNPGALQNLPHIRKLILDGKIPEAYELAEKYLAGIPGKTRSYQTLGDIYFQFDDTTATLTVSLISRLALPGLVSKETEAGLNMRFTPRHLMI